LKSREPHRIRASAEVAAGSDPVHYSNVDFPRGDLWVFTYGSLMWDPGFAHIAAEPGLLRGYHRTFCIYSSRYRGTVKAPGLVLGLDPAEMVMLLLTMVMLPYQVVGNHRERYGQP
jgi:cation transport regulator ChaC